MTISLINTGKRFNRDWIFRHLDYQFIYGKQYSITGPNGSGKSTLLQIVGGAIASSEGKIEYTGDSKIGTGSSNLAPENVFNLISIAAPYLELIEEMNPIEFLEFHSQFKSLIPSISIKEILFQLGLEKSASKQIRYFSSGMKQRLKLGQAIFSDTPVVLLDEPCTNLDAEGVQLYKQLIRDYCMQRLVIVSSNDEEEYGFCESNLNILEYK